MSTGKILVFGLLSAMVLTACGQPGQKSAAQGAADTSRYVYDDKGYPNQQTVENLFEEMDYQRAVQTYLWAVAPMALAGQQNMNRHFGAGGNFDFLIMYQDAGVKGMLTPNTLVR
jgi:hypothetical protein